MATILYLRITDGTTTITFADGATTTPGNYSIDGDDWAPVIAGPEAGELNGGYYPPVEETIPINITGSDSANMRANAQTLVRLLEQADRWARGDDTLAPVRLQYIPAGSSRTTSNPYERLILTSSQRDRNALQMPKSWSQSQATRFLLKAPMRFQCQGAWLNETDSPVNSAAAVSCGALFTITLASHLTRSPIDLSWTMPNLSAGNTMVLGDNTLILAPASADIIIVEAELATGTPDVSSVANANARGGNVLRVAAVGDSWVSGTGAISGLVAGTYAVYASVSASAAGFVLAAGFTLYAQLALTGDLAAVPASSTRAIPVLLGTINLPDPTIVSGFQLSGYAPGAGTFDIDYLVFVRLSDDVRILTIDGNIFAAAQFNTGNLETRITHRLTTHLDPLVVQGRSDGTRRAIPGLSGEALLTARGTTLVGVWMASSINGGGAGYAGPFRLTDSASAVFSSTFTATRRRAYQVPE